MDNRATDSGSEFVLDNRKLIIVFLLLLIICGTFFVIGFMEGKRQGLQARIDSTPLPPPSESIAETAAMQSSSQPVAEEEAEPAEAVAGREQLDWYKNVSQTSRPEARLSQPDEPAEAASPTSKRQVEGGSPERGNSETSSTAIYRVQVGAFKEERQAEVLSDALKAKGYSCEIEPPIPENELYRVKVGSFSSRAEAVATQLRLKKDGYSSFITTK